MDDLNVLDYLYLLWQRKWLIAITVVVCVIIAAVVLVFIPKTYVGETSLLFPEQGSGGISAQLAQLTGLSIPGTGSAELTGRGIYMTALKSRSLSENVCARLNLDQYGLSHKEIRKCMELEMPKDGGLVVKCTVPTSWLKGYVSDNEIDARSAELSALLANTFVDELRIFDQSNALFLSKKNRIFVEEQIERTKSELAAAESRLEDFRKKHPTALPPDKGVLYAEQAMQITAKRIEADVALEEAEGQLSRARATWTAGAPDDISPEAVIDSPVIAQLRADLAKLEVRRATLLEDFTEKHPDVVAITQEVENTRERISSEVGRIIVGQRGSSSPAHQELLKNLVLQEVARDGLTARRSALSDALSRIEGRLSQLPAEDMQYARLIRDLKTTEVVYTALLGEHAKARVAEGREADNFVVLDDAIVPDMPAGPRIKLILAASFMLGGMLGVLLATVQGVPTRKRSA